MVDDSCDFLAKRFVQFDYITSYHMSYIGVTRKLQDC
jgi:hypothetical protein